MFLTLSLQGQYLKKQSANTYVIGDKSFSFDELSLEFAEDSLSFNYYTQSRSAKSKAKTFGFCTLGAIGGSVLLMNSANNNNNVIDGFLEAGAGIGILVFVVPTLGTISLINLGKADKYRREAVNSLNDFHSDKSDSSFEELSEFKEAVSLTIGGTGKGVVISIQF